MNCLKKTIARLLAVLVLVTSVPYCGISAGAADNTDLTKCNHIAGTVLSHESVAPTCTLPGKNPYICRTCGARIENPVPPLGHDIHVLHEQSYDATYTEYGTTVEGCSRCEFAVETVVPLKTVEIVAVTRDGVEIVTVDTTVVTRDGSLFVFAPDLSGYAAVNAEIEVFIGQNGIIAPVTVEYNSIGENTPADITASGECGAEGDNVTWTLDSDGTLTISGTGDMENYSWDWDNPSPWQEENVKVVVIKNGVTSIGSSAFYDCFSLTSVTIPDSVTSIGHSAFERCFSLTSVTIPDSVTSIGDNAFTDCSALTSVIIPDSVTSIGDSAFRGCYSLTSVTIPDSVTSIGDEAFSGCSSLTSVTIPDSIITIGQNAFSHCTSLNTITIPSSVTTMSMGYHGDFIFYECSSLTAINVDADNSEYSSVDGVLFNKEQTKLIFYPDNKKGEYIIPDSVTTVEEGAFECCTQLTAVTVPDSVSDMMPRINAFYNCTSLRAINVDENNPQYSSLDGVLYNKAQNELMSFPAGRSGVFIIPDSVTGIRDCTFFNCSSLTSVTIPNSVTSIGHAAFAGCSSLNDVYYSGTEEQWQQIEINSYNESLMTAGIHYNNSNSVTWELDSEGTLTISGKGDMEHYDSDSNPVP